MINIFCVLATDHISETNKSLFFICRFERQPAKYDQLKRKETPSKRQGTQRSIENKRCVICGLPSSLS